MDKGKFQYEGLKWLAELELLNHPQLINQLKFNILTVSKQIKEVELLIYRENKSMLVLLELGWIGRTFQKKRIFTEVQEVLTLLLSNFRFRITDDPRIMEMAIEKVKKALTGGSNENASNPSNALNEQPDQPVASPAPAPEETTGSGASPQAGDEKPPETAEAVRTDVIGDDSPKE